MIVIGADTHKRTHALAAVDAGTGRVRGARQIKAEEPGHLAALRWARGLDEERVWAIEDCRHVSRRLEQALLAAGERVVGWRRTGWAPPGAASASRASRTRSTRWRSPGRSSRTGWSASPPPISMSRRWRSGCSPTTARIWLQERTRVQNRLRWHLLELCPELERSLGRGALEQPRQLDRIDRRLRRLPACARVRVAREQVAQIRRLTRQADALERELLALIRAHRPQLLAETGCGALTAAILIGRTAGAERFQSDASFARQAGAAPIPCSSGQRDRHRLDRGGDRQLNHALHIIAITRARHDPPPAYLARKRPKARPRRERFAASSATSPDASTRCSARPPNHDPQQHDTTRTDTTTVGAAPMPMPCLT